jgi:ATP-dependent exoDNAse (exonuclease V) beta subunit
MSRISRIKAKVTRVKKRVADVITHSNDVYFVTESPENNEEVSVANRGVYDDKKEKAVENNTPPIYNGSVGEAKEGDNDFSNIFVDAIDEVLAKESAKKAKLDANRKAIELENQKVMKELKDKYEFINSFSKIQSLSQAESPETRRARQQDIQLPMLPQMPTQEYNPNRFQYFVKG